IGEPELVMGNWITNGIVGMTRDGSIYYTVTKEKPQPDELWVMEGVLAKISDHSEISRTTTDIPSSELALGPNQSLLDRKFGLSVTYPTGWTINSATRIADGQNWIGFAAPEARQANPGIFYHSITPGSRNPGIKAF